MNRLNELRVLRGISLEELSNLSGISYDLLKRIERGNGTILNTREVARLSVTLHAKPSELFM